MACLITFVQAMPLLKVKIDSFSTIHLLETKVIEEGETHYGCFWMTCVKYRATGKPFPTLPRLLRHIREKHLPSSGKVVLPNQRGK
jgi:hypothetical protein